MLFRVSPRPRGGAIYPAGFILPCQPVLAHRVPLGPEWIHELKHDGHRLICRKEAGKLNLWTRPGNDRTDKFIAIRDAIAALPDDCVIDGEAAVDHVDIEGYDFFALASNEGRARAELWAFDLLFFRGEDIRARPLEQRRQILRDMIGNGAFGHHFSHNFAGPEGQAMFDQAAGANLEGIVSKRLGSRYRSGPTDTWRKNKNPSFHRVAAP